MVICEISGYSPYGGVVPPGYAGHQHGQQQQQYEMAAYQQAMQQQQHWEAQQQPPDQSNGKSLCQASLCVCLCLCLCTYVCMHASGFKCDT